jgi:ATP-dependent Lon protease
MAKNNQRQVLPMVALRGLVIFPYMVLHFDVGRDKSIAALEEAMANDQLIFLCAQKDIRVEEPETDDIFEIGTLSKIKQVLKLPGDNLRVLVEGINRARIVEYIENENYLMVEVEKYEETFLEEGDVDVHTEALMRTVLSMFDKYSKQSNKISPEAMVSVSEVKDPGQLADIVASNIVFKFDDKQRILECFGVSERLEEIIAILSRELEISNIENEIVKNVKKQIDKSQREYYLREQMKAIQKELGEGETLQSEVEELREKIEKANLSEEARKKAEKELGRMEKMSAGSPEVGVIRSYLDWIVGLPWGVETQDNMDLAHAATVLDEDHFGLEKVKERILEYLAVRKMKNDMHGPILCFVGPPGVGKTSIARSIARALDRKFVRTSLGGVRDEAEIRGHRRTYIGAIPGRIISSIKQAGSLNPVFLFDEIDKMSHDFRGDPASAMLEVLDPEINNAFRDHYLDLEFDLSRVMFLTTANSTDTIPRPLLDRMELIELSSYTENEKAEIAKRHLIKKQCDEHGLKDGMLEINEAALSDIINLYTSESGVRSLERRIADVCRKAAREILETGATGVRVTRQNLYKYLGYPRYRRSKAGEADRTGVVTGLAWTAVGGQTLPVEAMVMDGTGKIELTGHLGDVMKESAKAGISYIRSRHDELGIDKDFYEKKDIHIHCPEGAIPKDGPSAGITMATAVLSALTDKPVRKDVAMTGEITLTGNVLPIGGLKEKVLAALRAGIKTVIIPKENEKDIYDLPQNIRRKLKFIMADDVMQVFDNSIVK